MQSLGLQTDLMLIALDEGVIDDFGGAIRVRSPANPDFFFGNFLLYPDAPAPGDSTRWPAEFAAAFADDPRIRHACMCWDRIDDAHGAAAEFAELGFQLDHTLVLVTQAPLPAAADVDVAIRRIATDAEWDAVTELQIATTSEAWGSESEAFSRRAMARARRLTEAGYGAFAGAFAGDELAGDMGVYVRDGLGRFQAVETAPVYRRRGICRALLHHVSHHAFEHFGARDLVIIGEAGTSAELYRRAGFVERERLTALLRRPPEAQLTLSSRSTNEAPSVDGR